MDRASLFRFIRAREMLDDPGYLAATVIFAAAPTLAGLKPATLLSFTRDGRDLRSLWAWFKREVSARLALEYFELAQGATRTLVLFYRRRILEKFLSDPEITSFLADLGYEAGLTPADLLQSLREKIRIASPWPHEIGVFLGIPLEDVKGFIEYQGRRCLLHGYWQVYHDPARARRTFARYDWARSAAVAALPQVFARRLSPVVRWSVRPGLYPFLKRLPRPGRFHAQLLPQTDRQDPGQGNRQ